MKIAFLHSDKTRERQLSDAFLMGCRKHGHETLEIPLGPENAPGDYDVAVMFGVKSRERFYAHRRAGVHVVYLDKGYARHRIHGTTMCEYWRVAIDAHQPTDRMLNQKSPDDRRRLMGWEPKPWRTGGSHVLFCGSSAKYHAFYDMPDPTDYARAVCKVIRRQTRMPVWYRPKPSWKDAVPIRRTVYSGEDQTITDALRNAFVMVTHGSNACFEAVMEGVPCIVLGDAVAKPISSEFLADVADPPLASEAERRQWLSNLAYWEWTAAEFASGEAWEFIGGQIHG